MMSCFQVEWTKQLVAEQQKKTIKIKKDTEKMKAISDAEREKEVEAIRIARAIEIEEGERNKTAIKSQAFNDRMRVRADAMNYVASKEAESNRELLTPEYIQLQVAKNMMNNTKLYFSGDSSIVGGLLSSIYDNQL